MLVDMGTSLDLHVDMKSSGTGAMSIGEAARHFGLATHVLRHWESMGLLAPARSDGERRRYEPTDLYRIAIILRAKEAGMELAEIRDMMAAPGSEQRRAILRRRRADLAQRIAAFQASLALVDCALACEHDDIATCERFQQFVNSRITPDPTPIG
jgi:MerR family transcriptional regulator, copper efflux regulator